MDVGTTLKRKTELCEAMNERIRVLEVQLRERTWQLVRVVKYGQLLKDEIEYFGLEGMVMSFASEDMESKLRLPLSRVRENEPSREETTSEIPEWCREFVDKDCPSSRDESTQCSLGSEVEDGLRLRVERETKERIEADEKRRVAEEKQKVLESKVVVLRKAVEKLEREKGEAVEQLSVEGSGRKAEQRRVGQLSRMVEEGGKAMSVHVEQQQEQLRMRNELFHLLQQRVHECRKLLEETESCHNKEDIDNKLKSIERLTPSEVML